jgi:trimeric autotransporter adhesin
MKKFLRIKDGINFFSLSKKGVTSILFFLFTIPSFSQTFFGASSTPADNGNQAGTVAAVTPPASMVAGDLVILYAQSRGVGATFTVTTTGGQTWNSGAAYSPGAPTTQSIFITWCRFNGTWAANPAITSSSNQGLSIIMYVYRPSVSTNLWGVNINQTNTASNVQTANTINSVTTTMPNTVTMAFWSNSTTTTWTNLTGAGWSNTGLTAQYRNTNGAGQSHAATYRIQTTPGATGTISLDQTAATNTLRSIMSWHELSNDNCTGAIPVPAGVTCSNTPGSLSMATNSGVTVGVCTGTPDDDVWYSFVAADPLQMISLSSVNGSITGAGVGQGGGVRVQVFSGTCGALTSLACGTANATMVPNLTVGSTYYVRIYSANNTPVAGAAGFNICVITPAFFGKSFINTTKGLSGGTVETGDVLEVRASIVVKGGILDSCAFFDNIPAGTTYVPGSLAILTNEGKVYKGFTDAINDDEGSVVAGAVRINIGYNQTDNPSTAFRRGRIASTHRPVVGGGCLMLASYRVTVTQTIGNTINTGGGTFTYSLSTDPTTIFTKVFNTNTIIIYTNTGLCSNATGLNLLANNIAGDFDGTFGSGNTMNRIASPNVPAGHIYTRMNGNDPGDFFYSVVNNTSRNSAGFSTVNTWPKPQSPVINRVYGVFDVIGDHTGAVSPTAGNSAADTTNGGIGGYMMLINSAYNLDTVFKYNISNLCPSTYYEISCWVRNICSRCGVDSVGNGASGVSVPVGYIPTAPNDSSGVYPNLSFSVDNINHYTTGNVRYTGQWVKKGFTFITGPAQTGIQLAIANNAPGGGGNDWALDDIQVSNCLPNMSYSPSVVPDWCINNPVFITDTVRSIYNNYVYYKWQRSTDAGASWTDITGSIGPATPTLIGSVYQYVATYTVPWFWTGAANALDKYRLVVSTTAPNLSNANCSSTDVVNTVTINYIPCLWPLNVTLLSFNGKLADDKANLSWTTSKEDASFHFDVQKSLDGVNYNTIGSVNSYGNTISETNQYSFIDPVKVDGKAHYRIVMVSNDNKRKISRVIQLTKDAKDFSFGTVINPFSSELQFEVFVPKNASIEAELIDQNGKAVKKRSFYLSAGTNSLSMPDAGILSQGIYTLRLHNSNGSIITKRVMKK